MQIHWGWAIVGGLAAGAVVAWWLEKPGDRTIAALVVPAASRAATAPSETGPTLYRWVDAHGVVNVSSERPPAGTRFTVVHIRPDQNVVPLNR